MKLSNLLERLEGFGVMASENIGHSFAALANINAIEPTARFGETVMATGVANDAFVPPANDSFRPHILSRRVERRSRRDVRSA